VSLRIGLTGGIGSGKSTAANWLSARGAWVVDADEIARSLTEPGGAAMEDIRGTFGVGMFRSDGGLDRQKMRQLVFSDPIARRNLESILHPRIRAVAEQQAAAAGPEGVVLLDIPLLAESPSWRSRLDRILVIDCDVGVQIARVQARSGWPAEEVRRVVSQQSDRARRRSVADAVVVNSSADLDALALELRALVESGFFGAMGRSGPM
jgi:dephospho-CoA kinase